MIVKRERESLCSGDAPQSALHVASHILAALFFSADAHGDLRRTIVRCVQCSCHLR